jgi:Putative zinc-finger
MEHQKYKDWIKLYFFNELGKREQQELDEHLMNCSECKAEFEDQERLISFLSKEESGKLPDTQLLNEARREFRAALRVETDNKNFGRNILDRLISFISTPYKFVLSGAAILLIGFFAGYLVYNSSTNINSASPILSQNQPGNGLSTVSLEQDNIQITNVHFLNKNPQTGEIEFTFDAVKPMQVKGNINDQKIQNILTYSMLNGQNPGVRLNSINAISENKKVLDDNDVKETLIRVVKFDENPGVRREAIKLLAKFPYDDEIKHAYLYVLSNDTTSGMRIEAINSLFQSRKEGSRFDDQELSIFKKKVETDNNNYVRYRAKTALQEGN